VIGDENLQRALARPLLRLILRGRLADFQMIRKPEDLLENR